MSSRLFSVISFVFPFFPFARRVSVCGSAGGSVAHRWGQAGGCFRARPPKVFPKAVRRRCMHRPQPAAVPAKSGPVPAAWRWPARPSTNRERPGGRLYSRNRAKSRAAMPGARVWMTGSVSIQEGQYATCQSATARRSPKHGRQQSICKAEQRHQAMRAGMRAGGRAQGK